MKWDWDKYQSVQDVTRLLYRYCETTDTGDYEGHVELFENGKWFTLEPGAEPYREWLEVHLMKHDGRTKAMHLMTNLVVDVDDDNTHASSTCYVVVFQALEDFPLQPITVARFESTFERLDGTWVFREHKILPWLLGDTSQHLQSRRRKEERDRVDA